MAEGKLADPIGLPLDRVDGQLKVTGRATYAFEYATQGGAAYGVIVPAAVAKGRVVAVDVRDAERAPGVLLVLTKDNAPPQSPWGPVDLPDRFARASPRSIPTRCVISASRSRSWSPKHSSKPPPLPHWFASVTNPSPGQYDLRAAEPHAEDPGHISDGSPADSAVGNFEAAFAAAPVKIEAIYTTPYQNQAPMEPHATMAVWEGQKLTVHTSAQLTTSPQEGLARTLNIPKEDVRVITRYVGGGFGNKLPFYVDATLAAIGARIASAAGEAGDDPTPALSHDHASHRIGAAPSAGRGPRRPTDRLWPGRACAMCALRRLRRTGLRSSPYALCRAQPAHPASPGKTRSAAVGFDACAGRCDRPVGARMRDGRTGRRPRDRSGGVAATKRHRRSIPSGTSRSPRAISPKRCARAPPASAGTNALQGRPVSAMGAWLIGLGVASAIRADVLRSASARARLERDGRLIVELAMTDIGTGTYTILSQIAAEAMGLPVERVTIRLGDTRFPPTAGSGGSFGAATSGAAVLAACRKLQR